MAGMMSNVIYIMVASMMMPVLYTEAAIQCPVVASYFAPCLKYLISSGGEVPPRCCDGLKSLNGVARTTPDRQQSCTCLINFYKSTPNINPDNAAGLSGKCGVNMPYLSPKTDCSKVQ